MSTVTFLSAILPKAVTVKFAAEYEQPTLLSLAQANGIPLRCDCLNNGCGECAVKVAAVRPSDGTTVALTDAEKSALWHVGKLTAEQYRARALAARTPLWRLACRYVLGDEHIWVAF
jgi:ferredoxin